MHDEHRVEQVQVEYEHDLNDRLVVAEQDDYSHESSPVKGEKDEEKYRFSTNEATGSQLLHNCTKFIHKLCLVLVLLLVHFF